MPKGILFNLNFSVKIYRSIKGNDKKEIARSFYGSALYY